MAMAAPSGLPGICYIMSCQSFLMVVQEDKRDTYELDILNTSTIWDGDGVDDCPVRQPPETECIGSLDAECWLEDRDRDDLFSSQ